MYHSVTDTKYELVFTPEQARAALEHIRNEAEWALDFETTSLEPSSGRVRLASVCNGVVCYLFDFDNCGSFEDLAPHFVGPMFYVFAVGFEGKWFKKSLDEDDFMRIDLVDIIFLRRAKVGGGWPHKLAEMAKRDIKITLNKEEQASDWARTQLSGSQLRYAAYDGWVTWWLFEYWVEKLTDEQFDAALNINDAWRGNVEMQETGLYLDEAYHMKNIKRWTLRRDVALRYFEKYTPKSVIKNPNSNVQMSNFLKAELSPAVLENWPVTGKRGDLQLDRDTLKQAAFRLPYPMNRWLISFIILRMWNKYLSTYGDTLVTINRQRGKITGRFNMMAAITGRYSSSGPNMQNIPRKPYIRRAFYVPPWSKERMVLADYSGIEVRVLAELSGDEQLKQDAIYGDVHGSGAVAIDGLDEDRFFQVLSHKPEEGEQYPLEYYKFKELRNNAKVFTFRLTYGAGLGALSLSLKRSIDETQRALDAWAERYPKAYAYRQEMFNIMDSTGYLPVCDGRTIFVNKKERSIPIAANYPIQGAAATVMYRAVHHVHKLYYERDIRARLAATVHDELLSYALDYEEAHKAKVDGMTQGWLDVFPNTSTANLIEHVVGYSWRDKP